jgi:putative Holliday junction resolvase
MRMLGIDFGEKRIGLALSDPQGIIASPYEVLERTSDEQAVEAISERVAQHDIARILIGLPLNMDGTDSALTRRVRSFARKLEHALAQPVILWDERLSTRSAEQVLLQADTRRSKRRKVIDKIAAQIILQHYLDAMENMAENARNEW